MRKRLGLLLSLMVGLFVFSVSAAFAQTTSSGQNIDPVSNDAFAMTILENGADFQDSFSDLVGTRLYGFHGSAGDVVSVTMTQITTDLDPFLVLLGPRGEVVASDDDSGLDPYLSAAITDVTLPTDGSYLIIASSFVNIDSLLEEISGTQEYIITLDGNTPPTDLPDFDPDVLILATGTLDAGMTVEGASTAEEPVFYYTLTAKAGDTLNFVVEDADFDTILHLFDATGSRVAVNDDDEVDGGLTSAIRDFTVPEDGSYLLMVTDIFFYSAGDPDAVLSYEGGTYTLSVSLS